MKSKLGPVLYEDLAGSSEYEMYRKLNEAGFSEQRASELVKILMYVKLS